MSSPPTQPLLPADVKPALDCVIPTVLIIICIIIALLSFSFGVLACVYAFIMRAESLSIVHRQPENIPLGDLSGANKAPGPRLSIESEGTLHAGLAKLDEQIQKHVRDNYLRGEEQVDRNKLAVTIACLPFLKHDPEFLTELCAAPNTRQAALRHLIASTVISAIDFTMPNEHTLLPPSVFTFCKSVQSCLESNRNFLLFHLWQITSVALLQEEEFVEGQNLEPPEAVQSQILNLVARLDLVLSNFTPTGEEARRKQLHELEDLIRSGARLGYRILSHNCRWSFSWQADRNELVLLPRLLQLGDASGKMLNQPNPVGSVVIATVRGRNPGCSIPANFCTVNVLTSCVKALQSKPSTSTLTYRLPVGY